MEFSFNLSPIQLNMSCRFLSFFGILAWVRIFSDFWKYLMIKRLFFWVPLSFPLKIEFSFSLAPTQLNWSCRFLVFSEFCLSFFRIFLEFWVFLGLSFFRNVQKKACWHPKQNATSLLTPFFDTVFDALSHGTLSFALRGSYLSHFLIGGNSSTANQILCNKWLLKL